jgi:hypothetical protein
MNLNVPVPMIPNYDSDVLVRELGQLDQNAPGTGRQFTSSWYQFFDKLRGAMLALPPVSVTDLGARMDGSDDTGPFQNAINRVVSQGGGILTVPNGTLSTNMVATPKDAPPILLVGQSAGSTFIELRGNLQPGVGMLDINSSFFSMADLTLQTKTTTPRGLQYGVDFLGINGNDPLANSIAQNSSLWIHAGAHNFTAQRVRFRRAAAYSAIVDAMDGDINDPSFINCWSEFNWPTLFGTNPADLNYGSWNGGILIKGDGRSPTSGVVRGLLVAFCRWKKTLGNNIWSHLYGLDRLHSDFRIIGNSFLDSGLDAVEIGGVTGGVVSDNTFRRIGYISLTEDDAVGTPRWLAGVSATALDSAGVVKHVNYKGNSFMSVNGGALDLDGHSFSVLSSNSVSTPYPDENEYLEDKIAICGPTNSGQNSFGVNTNNTNQTAQGATNIEIVGNEFINLRAGALRLYAARRVNARGNGIVAPPDSVSPPVALGPVGAGPYQRCYDCKVIGNDIDYNPPAPAPAIVEDETVSGGHPFTAGEKNTVCANNPITPSGTLAVEFQKSPTSGSTVYGTQVWF